MKKNQSKRRPKVLINILCGAALVAVLFLSVNILLRVVTQHNITVTVPDLVGEDRASAQALAEQNNLQLVITDSVYVSRFRRGCVYAQNPKAGEKVKKGRKIYLTMNASHEKQVLMPDLVGYSLRQAKVELTSRKLKLGKLFYVNDIATNNVLAQMRSGQAIAPGTSIDVGTVIDLQLGLDPEDAFSAMPDFTGYKYQRALSSLQDNSFNFGAAVFDETVKTYSDSLAAFVYRQSPAASEEETVRLGTAVKLYFTLDATKLPVAEEQSTEEQYNG